MKQDILNLVAPRLGEWRRQGADDVAFTCPYHQLGSRRTFTLSLSLTRGVFYCFSCGEKGHLARLLDKLDIPDDGFVSLLLAEPKKH